MDIKQLVEQAKANVPLQLGQMPDARAITLLREAFAVILNELENTGSGDEPLKVVGLGSFRVREIEIEQDGQTQQQRRILFRPAPPKNLMDTLDTFSARSLILVRLGSGHRIASWLTVPRTQRGWDLALSLYEEAELGDAPQVDYMHYYRGGKWDGIHAFFTAHPEVLAAYDYFWLVDDDIDAPPHHIDALFNYARAHKFELAQPALTLDSYYSHRLTLCCPGFTHRHTNFVEIMAPLLARHLLERALPLFAGTMSGLGIDWYWQRLADDPDRGVAIIDALPVGHYRPLKKHLRSKLQEYGINPHDERRRLAQSLRLSWLNPVAHAGLRKDGRTITGRLALAYHMTRAYWRARRDMSRRPWRWGEYPIFFCLQIIFRVGYKK